MLLNILCSYFDYIEFSHNVFLTSFFCIYFLTFLLMTKGGVHIVLKALIPTNLILNKIELGEPASHLLVY